MAFGPLREALRLLQSDSFDDLSQTMLIKRALFEEELCTLSKL